MASKLINTLKYGSGKTKRKLYLMFGILAAGVVFSVLALVYSNAMLGLAAFLVIFIDGLILFNTSFEQKKITVNPEEDMEPGALEWIASEKKAKKEKKREASGEEEVTEEDEEEVTEDNPFLQYDEKKLKKLFVAYKVKKHHVPVMIDMCQAERIVQSPAYLWKDSVYLYFLVLGDEPRLLKSKVADSDTIHIRRGMAARPMEEYEEMNEPSLISMVFGKLLPKYYKKEENPYRAEFKKNLYSAAPGIWCTSASVKNMMKLLPERFVLDDGKIAEESVYYQEIYIARVMYWDGIYTGQEYKEKVLEILGELIRAELAEGIVREYLNAMMMKGLIPREYAEYVLSKRKVM